jgi:hypothetical protein
MISLTRTLLRNSVDRDQKPSRIFSRGIYRVLAAVNDYKLRNSQGNQTLSSLGQAQAYIENL